MKTIVAALDFSEITELVVKQAARLARVFECTLYLLHVEPPDPENVGHEPDPEYTGDNDEADTAVDRHQAHVLRDRLRADGLNAQGLVVKGSVAEKVIEEAERLDADLILLGTHGHGAMYHMLLGSVSELVIKRSHCPVLVVPSRLHNSL